MLAGRDQFGGGGSFVEEKGKNRVPLNGGAVLAHKETRGTS